MINLSHYTQQIRDRLKVSELIGRDIKLSRKGNEFSGLCPFHHEKSPSFTINDHKGFYHCFGCGAHGDVINYVMQRQNLDFQLAVKELADLVGIRILETETRVQPSAELYQILEFSCQWFQDNLQRSIGEKARAYLQERNFSKDTQNHFCLGFAPDSSQGQNSLFQALEKKGFNKTLILKSGVVIQTEDRARIYDRFRGRLMFPIWDLKGQVIAFGGRILTQRTASKDQAKYINSSETELFHKGQNLYAYHHAIKHINKDIPPIVVEGYCDVIALHQAGWKTAIAPLGTALTEPQLSLLWRRHPYPILCFDGDQAGLRASFKATERALPLLKTDKSLKVCYLPEGEDPDSLLKSKGSEFLKQFFESSLNLVDSLWNNLLRANSKDSLSTPEAKAHFKKEVADLIKTIQDPDIRRFYEMDFSQRLRKLFYHENYSPEFRKGGVYPSKTSIPLEAPKSLKGKNDLAHKILLAILIVHPILLKEVFEQFAALDFQEEVWHDLKRCMLEYPYEDFETLKEKLEHAGFVIILKELFDKELTLHAPFAMPGSDPQVALERWREIWHHTTWKQQVKGDLKQAQEHTKQSFDHKAWEKMKLLKTTLVP